MLILRRILCFFNVHCHPEKDGLHASGSYGRCYACGKIIVKNDKGFWKAVEEK